MLSIFVQKCVETLETEDDDTQVQGGAENHMKVQKGYQGNVQIQRDTENHMQLLERDADVRQPFRQDWEWRRIAD